MTQEHDNDPRMERAIRYVEGDMDAAERTAFERELFADTALRDDVEAARETITGLRSLGEEKLRAELRNADVELDTSEQGPGTRKWWLAAAAVILLAGFAWWLVPGETPQELAKEFEIIEPGLPVLMGASPRSMDEIMNAYKQNNLATAGQLLELALSMDAVNDTLRYYNGVVLERTQDCDKSTEEFSRVPKGSIFEARAMYRSALCMLGKGDVRRARVLLDLVIATEDPQLSARSRELVERLK